MKKFDTKKMSKTGKRILSALEEVSRGEILSFPEVRKQETKINITLIRKKLGMDRTEFAKAFNLSKFSVRNWELGLRKPSKAIQAFLLLIQSDPLDAFKKLHQKG